MNTSTRQSRTCQTQRTMAHAPEAVYAAFSDPAQLATWWGPNGFTNTFQRFEFKADGVWDHVMHGPDGQDYPNKSVFRELVIGKKLVIQHVNAPRFTLSVTLEQSGDGTLVVWVQEFEDQQVAEAVRHICEPGNEQNLDRLQRHLSGAL